MKIIQGYLFSYLYVFGVLLTITTIKKLYNIRMNDVFRKTVHILIVFTWISLYIFLYDTWHFIIIPLSFVLITVASAKYGVIKIVERDTHDGTDYGIIHYSISMTFLCMAATFFPISLVPCGIGIFALAFGDGFAAVFGQAFRKANLYITKTKTLAGAGACFIFTIIGILVLRVFIPFSISIISLIVVGIVAAIMEVIGGKYDNYTVPFGTAAMTMLMRIGEV